MFGRHSPFKRLTVPALVLLASFYVGTQGNAGVALAKVTATNSYDVSGTTLAEVWADIQTKGFNEGGTVYAGEARTKVGSPEVDITPTCQRVPMTDCEGGMGWECTATMSPVWGVETVITLPSWAGAETACDNVKAEWNRFLAALKTHEEGHDAAAEKALADAKPANPITSGPKQDCDQANAAAAAIQEVSDKFDAELERLQKAVDTAHDTYDTATGHGAAQGATLDTSIKCDEQDDSPAGKLKDMVDDLDLLLDDGLRTSLQKKLQNAIKSIEKGDTKAAQGQISAFIREVKAQRGKKLDRDAADAFVKTAEEIKKELK